MKDLSLFSRLSNVFCSVARSTHRANLESGERKIIIYRLLLTLAPILIIGYGLIYRRLYPNPVDPLWARITLIILPIGILVGSYRSEKVRELLPHAWRTYLYLVTIWVVAISALNGFAPEYIIGLVLVLASIAGVFSIGAQRIQPVVYYLAFAGLLPVASLFTVPSWETHHILLIAAVVSIGLLFYPTSLLRVWMQNSLRRSEMRYRSLIEQASDGIFIFSPTEGFEQVNQQACEMTGYRREELLSMEPEDIITSKNLREDAFPREDVMAGETVRYELEVRRKDQSTMPVEISVKRIEKDMIQAIVRDITRRLNREEELIEAKEEAEEMSRLKSSFLANMSHEIRTPLASIRGYVELLTREASSDLQPLIRPIDLSSKRLFETLNSVLDLAQLESGTINLSPQFVDVAALTRESVETFKQQARQKDLSLEVETDPENIPVYLDRGVLVRSLNNLIGNAIKFTEQGGVTVRAAATEQTVRIEVEDTGVGISPDYLPKLYEAFSQESTGASREYEGTGLGLTITHQLIDLANGSLDVESTKGVGTTFTITLPRLADEADGHPNENPLPASVDEMGREAIPPGQRVLIIDDDRLMRELLCRILPNSYSIDLAADASSALETSRADHFDVILLDINLKDKLDGVDVLHQIRRQNLERQPFILAVTAYALPGDEERFLEEGFDGYVSKPFLQDNLYQELAQLAETIVD